MTKVKVTASRPPGADFMRNPKGVHDSHPDGIDVPAFGHKAGLAVRAVAGTHRYAPAKKAATGKGEIPATANYKESGCSMN